MAKRWSLLGMLAAMPLHLVRFNLPFPKVLLCTRAADLQTVIEFGGINPSTQTLNQQVLCLPDVPAFTSQHNQAHAYP